MTVLHFNLKAVDMSDVVERSGGVVGALLASGLALSFASGCGGGAPATATASRTPAPASGTPAPASGAPATASGAPATASGTPAPSTYARAASPGTARTAGSRPGVNVTVTGSRYGRILIDGSGRTLYLFSHDRRAASTCGGACAVAWPPFLTRGRPHVRGLPSTLLGTTRRGGGSPQVTYAGHPLYYYRGDQRPGEILCQAVQEFGGFWYVVSPRGGAIQ
jgi:predicted lipoprotein with Yx(FWY)xxD motif